jgi:hypothetical protein
MGRRVWRDSFGDVYLKLHRRLADDPDNQFGPGEEGQRFY